MTAEAICAASERESWDRRGRERGVISPFKAPLGISVKVEISDPLPREGGRIILAGVASSRCSFLVVARQGISNGTRVSRNNAMTFRKGPIVDAADSILASLACKTFSLLLGEPLLYLSKTTTAEKPRKTSHVPHVPHVSHVVPEFTLNSGFRESLIVASVFQPRGRCRHCGG